MLSDSAKRHSKPIQREQIIAIFTTGDSKRACIRPTNLVPTAAFAAALAKREATGGCWVDDGFGGRLLSFGNGTSRGDCCIILLEGGTKGWLDGVVTGTALDCWC